MEKLRPEITDLLTLSKKSAGKEVANLTYARLAVTPETKPWPFVQISNEISSVINVFLQKYQKTNWASNGILPARHNKGIESNVDLRLLFSEKLRGGASHVYG